jgi:FkbM family methyltransferase
MHQILPDCQTVFDVGANAGQWTALALSIKPTLNIHCFEPSRFTYEKLLQNKFPPNVICNNIGFGAAPQEATLWVFGDGSGTNSLYQRAGLQHVGLQSQTREERVRLDTIDRYCRQTSIQTLDFLKLDVEGHEFEVLKGMRECLSKGQVKIIQFEYGGCNIDARTLLKDIWVYFDSLPYSFYKIYPKEIRKVESYSQAFENFQYQNWIICHKDAQSAWPSMRSISTQNL